MKPFALALAIIALAASVAPATITQEHWIAGKCLTVNDISHFDPHLGFFQLLSFRPIGTSQTIVFASVSPGAPGTLEFCPPIGESEDVILTFRVEPHLMGFVGDVPVYALEALELVMMPPGSPAEEVEMIGNCLLLDDVAHFDPVFGTFVYLVFRPVGALDTITFVSAGTIGAGSLCPPPPPVMTPTRLTFRVEPQVSGMNGDVVLYALEALEVAMIPVPPPW